MKRIVLAGAGHAHAVVLAELAKEPLYGATLTLVSPYREQLYSAMLPGVIGGHYRRAEAEFDVTRLAKAAHAEHIVGSIVALDPKRRVVKLDNRAEVAYDVLSLNVGSRVDDSVPGAVEYAISVKPFEALFDKLRGSSHVAIAGGGASGAELAMAMRYAGAEVTLFAEPNGLGGNLGRRVAAALRRARVDYRPGMRVDAIGKGPLVLSGSARQEFDRVVLATGAAPLGFFARSGLALDAKGFVLVDEYMRSVSHPEVFALGDCAALAEAKSGVHAVRQGAVLERNLRHLVKEEPLEPYHAGRRALLILTCGARYAIAARGALAAEGRWVWWWKNWIDRRWLARLNDPLARRGQ